MKILTVDIGNSNICIGCANDHKVEFVERMHSDRNKPDLEYAVLVKMVLNLHQIDIFPLHVICAFIEMGQANDVINQRGHSTRVGQNLL